MNLSLQLVGVNAILLSVDIVWHGKNEFYTTEATHISLEMFYIWIIKCCDVLRVDVDIKYAVYKCTSSGWLHLFYWGARDTEASFLVKFYNGMFTSWNHL